MLLLNTCSGSFLILRLQRDFSFSWVCSRLNSGLTMIPFCNAWLKHKQAFSSCLEFWFSLVLILHAQKILEEEESPKRKALHIVSTLAVIHLVCISRSPPEGDTFRCSKWWELLIFNNKMAKYLCLVLYTLWVAFYWLRVCFCFFLAMKIRAVPL